MTARRNPHALGFTLVEILIALAILAITLAATGRATRLSIDTAAEVRLRTLAGWVAENRAAELTASAAFPAPGDSLAQVEMAGVRFTLRQKVSETPKGSFRRVDLVVSKEGDSQAAAKLTTFLTRRSGP